MYVCRPARSIYERPSGFSTSEDSRRVDATSVRGLWLRRNVLKLGLVAVLVLSLSLPMGPAAGWSNGSGGCGSYGTHDWVLDQALQRVGEEAAWVRTRVALRSTDDPDCADGIDHASGTWWHVYDVWGASYGGAPEAAQVWFRRMKRRLAKDRPRAASRALGYLAHIVGDIAQPMHTDSTAREDRVHSSYEDGVDRRIGNYRFHYDGRHSTRPYRRTVRLAHVAHRSYFDLVRAYDRRGYNQTVHRITKRQLNRGANAVADLLTSL